TSAIHSGRFAIKRDLVDPAAIVLDTIELYRGEAAHKQITLVPELAKDVRVPCDPGRVAQALGNVLGNAIKFCRPGDRIAVQLGLDRDAVQIVVADTGPGIAEPEIQLIFDPYWTTARDAR